MKKIKITVLRKTCHRDLMEQYENPIEHACDLYEGQVFTTDGWRKPDGLCDSAWQTLSPFVMTLAHLRRLDEESRLGDDLLQRRVSPRELSDRNIREIKTLCDPPF